MARVSYAIRILPLTLIRKPIKIRFIQSFLYYVPYVTLAVMTFPAIINATQSPIAGAAALVVGIAAAWFGASRLLGSVSCCAVVLVLELCKQQESTRPVYSDSRTALSWLHRRGHRSKLKPTAENATVKRLLARADA